MSTEHLYAQEAARIPTYGMQQVLYPDLTMTIALGDSTNREARYFEQYRDNSLSFYHTPTETFTLKFQPHIAQEIRFLALIPNHLDAEPLSKVWPVRSVTQSPRDKIDTTKTGKHSSSKRSYFVFELGQPLTLPTNIAYKPDGTFRYSMKLTTLNKLESVKVFSDIEMVYKEALV